MRRRRSVSMFPCRVAGNDQRMFATGLLSLFIGTFLLASQPRVPGFLGSNLPDRESKLLNVGNWLHEVITGRGLKSADFQSETRLSAGKVCGCPAREGFFLRAIVRTAIPDGSPTAGSFLIRSPPYATTLA